jgi:hypothetical protein
MSYYNVDEICRAHGLCGSASWAKYDSCNTSSHYYNKVKLALGLIDYAMGEKGQWVCSSSHSWPRYSAEVALHPVKFPRYRLNRSLCAAPRRSGRSKEGKNLLSLSGFVPKFRDRPTLNLVTTQTVLCPTCIASSLFVWFNYWARANEATARRCVTYSSLSI